MADTLADTVTQQIAGIVGPEHVRPATPADAIDGVEPLLVVAPATPSQIAQVLAVASAGGRHVVPKGGGTKLDWGNVPAATDIVLSTHRLDRLLEHAAGDMTATVEAGCTIAGLQRRLAERGQRLALDPLWPEQATVGGVFATGDNGSLRTAFGPPRDLILGVTVALSDGTLARSGGKVVKNVAGYDLPKLLTGSFGTLGVITQVTVRLHPLPAVVRKLQFPLSGPVDRFAAALRECSLVTTAVQFDAGTDAATVAQVRVEGAPNVIDQKCERIAKAVAIAGFEPDGKQSADVWTARESLFDDRNAPAIVCRVSLLPTWLPAWFDLLRQTEATHDVCWRYLGQLAGTGLLRLQSALSQSAPSLQSSQSASQSARLLSVVALLRKELVNIGGSLVMLRCPAGLKSQAGVWGDPGDALPLMQRIKQRFDATNTLNPGRFVGGI